MRAAFTILLVAATTALSLVAYSQSRVLTQQSAALELWSHCPMPTKGVMLVIEADWPDQPPEEKYRCSLTKKRLPGKLGQPLPRRDS